VAGPRGTLTFLFTDIEGSTRGWVRDAVGMGVAVARHDEILRQSVEAHRGKVVKTTGDGTFAVFEVPSDAARAALDAQRSLRREQWADVGEVRVRMGIHSGEALERDGDYFGPNVNRAARLMAAAHGGQVVLSLAAAALVGDSLVADATFIDLGEHSLPDFERPERVYQLCAEGLRDRFEPLRTATSFRGNLPVQLSSFIGRTDDRHSLAKAVRESRVVTLTGPGGMGKTRLAIEVAQDLIGMWGDGIWFCDLVPATDLESTVQAVASMLGVGPGQDVSLAENLSRAIASKRLLVILDNCEHVLDALAPFVESLLRGCPGLRVLATSREPVGVESEVVVSLPPLGLPAIGAIAADAVECDAVRLFAERAAAVRSGFSLESNNVAAIVDICRRLDGIPLAIELAAARVVAMSPREIDEGLDHRMQLLTSAKRTTTKRHQTLRAAIDWSYSLLDETTRSVFDRLGVFVGTFDRAAARSVCSGGVVSDAEVVEALISLVGKSLVTAVDTPSGTTRYLLLETLREYAEGHLTDSGDVGYWRRRHAEHYTVMAEVLGTGLAGSDELTWRPALRADLPNIAAAVTWSQGSLDDDDEELACRAIAALARESIENRSAGIGAWAERGATRADRSNPGRRADILTAAAWSAFARGDTTAMSNYAAQALADGIPGGCSLPAWPHVALATSAWMAGDVQQMAAAIAEARREIPAATDDTANLSSFHSTAAAMIFDALGATDTARADAMSGLDLARRSQHPSTLARASWAVAWVTIRDDPAIAAEALEEGIALIEEGASDILLGFALGLRAELRGSAGDTLGALRALREAVARSVAVGDHPAVITVLARCLPLLIRVDAEFAVSIAGAVLDGPHAPMAMIPVSEKPTIAAHLASLTAVIGSERFEELRAGGIEMPYDGLIAFVLAGMERLIKYPRPTPS
jgi:predicted ATPase/class 3 adenylate cyclase